jgi:hypothetical protein
MESAPFAGNEDVVNGLQVSLELRKDGRNGLKKESSHVPSTWVAPPLFFDLTTLGVFETAGFRLSSRPHQRNSTWPYGNLLLLLMYDTDLAIS